VSDERDRFLEAVQRYIEAGEQLIAALSEFNAMNRDALGDLDGGMSVTESFSLRDSAGWSRRISALLDGFEATRRDTRTSAAAALMEEGSNVTDVGRAFGVSHQLASRIARGNPVDPGPPRPPGTSVVR
jgi:hypothetical protein